MLVPPKRWKEIGMEFAGCCGSIAGELRVLCDCHAIVMDEDVLSASGS